MPTKKPIISPELAEILAREVPGWYQLVDGRCQKVDWQDDLGIVPGVVVDSVDDIPEGELDDLEEDKGEDGDVELPWTTIQGESVRLDWLMEAVGVFALRVLESLEGAQVIVCVTRPDINDELAALAAEPDPPGFLHWPKTVYLTEAGWSSLPTPIQPSIVPELVTEFANEILQPNVDLKAWAFEIKPAVESD